MSVSFLTPMMLTVDFYVSKFQLIFKFKYFPSRLHFLFSQGGDCISTDRSITITISAMAMAFNRKEASILQLNSLKRSLSVLRPLIRQVTLEHDEIKLKTAAFHKLYREQLQEYHRAKDAVGELQQSMEKREQNIQELKQQLEKVTKDLTGIEKQIQDKARRNSSKSSVDMLQSLQRLKDENRDFDLLIGVLYHEVTQARKREGIRKRGEDDECDNTLPL